MRDTDPNGEAFLRASMSKDDEQEQADEDLFSSQLETFNQS